MRGIELLTVPYDSARRGWRMGAGPQALLRTGLVQALRRGGRDVELVPIEGAPTTDARESAFDLCARIARVVHAAAAGDRLPVLLAGNCMSTVGAIAGLGELRPGLLWFDAHADLNTPETSTSGFLDGMAAATCLGWCFQEEARRLDGFEPVAESSLVLAGARELDPPEHARLSRSAIRLVPVTGLGDDATLRAALDGVRAAWLHLDLDVLDPDSAGHANEFAAPGGATVEQLLAAIGTAGAATRIAGMTVSAYDPAHDPGGALAAAATSAITAVISAAA